MKLLHFFKDGGPVFTYALLILLLIILAFFIKGLIESGSQKKTISIMIHLSWFTIAWGMLGKTFGLIQAFDKVSASGDIAPHLLAGGLKMALINPLFSIIIFLIARAGILFLTLKTKEKEE